MLIPQKILIIRFSSLGDIIQVSAFANYLHSIYPQAEIHWLTKSIYKDLVDSIPVVDKFWGYDHKKEKLTNFCQDLKKEKFDLVCDLHSVWRSIIARHIIGGKQQLVYHKPYFKRWLLFYGHKNTFTPNFHVISSYCQILKEQAPKERPLTILATKESSLATIKAWLSNWDTSVPIVACITGAAWPQKRYPTELWIKLLKSLLAKSNCNIVLIGGPKESEPEIIGAALSNPDRVRVANKFSIIETLALLSCCSTAIGNDTGFMHGAEALGKDVIFLLGPTSVHGGGYPNRSGSYAAEANLPCRPCSQKGDRRCRKSCLECFYKLDQENLINELLSRIS